MYLRLIKHPMLYSPTTRNPRLATRALTLIEMLIGMAITLVMMAAVVTLFANIGSGVRVQRAAMEMSSQLRVARARLYADLAGATCAPRPKLPSDDHSDGYIEIVEGIYSDKNPSSLLDGNTTNGELDYAVSQVPSGADPQIVIDYDTVDVYARVAQPNDVTNGGGLGDYDDILALTVRSENEPFVGHRLVLQPGGVFTNPAHWIYETIESNLAEVIWYAVENPADGSLGEPGMRTVYRRVLLIAPWLSPIDLAAIPTSGGTAMGPDFANRFYQRFDISARYDVATAQWIPNSLSDLAKRENRFAHFFDNTLPDKGFPHALLQDAILPPNATPPAYPTGAISPLHPFGEPWFTPIPNFDDPDRQGEDVMLNDVLAFDVRVFDPGAPIFVSTGSTVEPSDFGWDAVPNGSNPVGYGAYADLYWNAINKTWNAVAGSPSSQFDSFPHLKSQLDFSGATIASVAYDTWSFHYENDGIDQDGDGTDLDNLDGDNDVTTGLDVGLDEGTDGLDNDNLNGTDDANERETSPPYDVPLRGIQVKLRVYEPDTRQIREATVTRGMVPQ